MSHLPGQQALVGRLLDSKDPRLFPARKYLMRVFPGIEAASSPSLEEVIGPLEIGEAEEYWFHLAGKSDEKILVTNGAVLDSVDTGIAQELDPRNLPRWPAANAPDGAAAAARAEFRKFYGDRYSLLAYARLVGFLSDQGVLGSTPMITLNYDLLLDRTLIAFDVRVNYGFSFFVDDPVVDEATSTTDVSSEAILIKLHGSLNWRMCDACHYLRNFRTRSIWPNSRCADCHKERARPMLIRPTVLKDFKHRVWQALWREAGHQLANAETWVIVGYSLPLADVWVLRMLLQSYRSGPRGRQPKRVIVVNPDEAVQRRFRLIFPESESVLSRFDSWMDAALGQKKPRVTS